MNQLLDSIRALAISLKRAGGVLVSYGRGNDAINITAIPGGTRHDDYSDIQEASLTARERDWFILAEDLSIGGSVLPQRGDTITWIDSVGTTHTYDVRPRAGDRCYRFTDQTMQIIRVYTVEAIASGE